MSAHTLVRLVLKKSKINVQNSQVEKIKRWIMSVKDIEKSRKITKQ